MRCTRGQATLDHLAVVAVVGALLAGGLAAADGRGAARAVHAGLVRALCVVTAGAGCAADLAPCPTGWRRDGRSWELSLSVVRVGAEDAVLRERRSDGSVVLTFTRHGSGGASAGRRLHAGAVDAEVRAALLSGAGRGTAWVLRDDAAADRLLERTAAWRRGEGGREPDIGPPDVTYDQRSGGRLEAALRLDAGLLGGGAHLAREVVRGVRRDHRSGEVTYYLQRTAGHGAAVRWRARRASGSGSPGAAEALEEHAVTVDARGRPVALTVLRTDPSGAVPGTASEVAALLPARRPGRVVVTEQRLDLGDGRHLEAARAAVRALAAGQGVGGPLRAALARDAVVHVRAYDREGHREDAGGDLDLGFFTASGSLGRSAERARLVGAVTRGIGGMWGRRADCVAR